MILQSYAVEDAWKVRLYRTGSDVIRMVLLSDDSCCGEIQIMTVMT